MEGLKSRMLAFWNDQRGATEASAILIGALILVPLALLVIVFGKDALDYFKGLGLNLFVGIALIALVAGGLNIFYRLMRGREGSAKAKAGKWLDFEFKVRDRQSKSKDDSENSN